MSDPSPDLDNRLRDYYESIDLPPDVSGDLVSLIRHSNREDRRQLWWQRPLVAVAIFTICILSTVLLAQTYFDRQELERVAAEIALNHVRRFDTEFEAQSIAALTPEMTQLDFAPVHPQRMKYENYELLGARYCTINDSIAVQIHLEDEQDHEYTLYEFREAIDVAPGKSHEYTFDEIHVTLWQEGEVVMGLAQKKQ